MLRISTPLNSALGRYQDRAFAVPKRMKRTKYRIEKFNKAIDLWRALDPVGPLSEMADTLIFRGQENSKWPLIPSLWRMKIEGDCKSAEAIILAEKRLLRAFIHKCDAIGLRLPSDHTTVRDLLQPIFSSGREIYEDKLYMWPRPEIFSLMALAQHHGLPTGLLDWCRRPHVAAYFAAEGALRRGENKVKPIDEIAVWVLLVDTMLSRKDFELVTNAGATTQNIVAQSGVLTYMRHFSGGSETHHCDRCGEECLRKFTLPVSEADEILRLCKVSGISWETLFPSYDGVVRSIVNEMQPNKMFESDA